MASRDSVLSENGPLGASLSFWDFLDLDKHVIESGIGAQYELLHRVHRFVCQLVVMTLQILVRPPSLRDVHNTRLDTMAQPRFEADLAPVVEDTNGVSVHDVPRLGIRWADFQRRLRLLTEQAGDLGEAGVNAVSRMRGKKRERVGLGLLAA
jgi:hypothetical protein